MTEPTPARPDRWAILCDFDGTAVMEDIGDRVAIRFAGHDLWRRECDAYLAGAFSFSALLGRIFEPITASAEEIAAFARQVAVLRPGFERFVAAARDAGRPFIVCSAGLDVYIGPVLERLAPELREYLKLRSNHATCSPEGMKISFHAGFEGCGRCGFCKGAVARALQAEGYRVVLCGDGTADRCAAAAADLVFARGKLVRYCGAERIPCIPFETFDEVLARFPPG
ncbi:MtnX-like HAD-IB family phosphatase [Anaeromyxobacter paludicola]|uniref:2-hydroxy-3-keto-5-methylthiopentenyl-1-phosphate phosphatase n=1 Tax=Anaeromyxobacter paludicola TaxID=2918171 RepID=A0ABM7XAX8_9BACT|nr:MtnX-like HAD-IB family phosphatase [Anaeromyxobacter paludicola]BDG09014.1 2-hydroxy-3-keto-5-methylthiopentenyl-1-phosphate phosphatase [Anaeromyxobacter paludicola]